MLCRNVLISCSLAVLLVKADLDTVPMLSLTSQDVPTESINVVTSDQLIDGPFYQGGVGGYKVNNGVTKDGTTSSIEDQDDDQSLDSDEGKR
ncbi:hypothetical protein AAFF_G00403160 [Aldrovandia affinis]|uniref:Secreted protein n=1 Tax=Aldrovandia affinis TaxID=143900 RepID=A0AAD7T7E4_9TELE|nr:hypothetical protein AAFF_G00403160 [Aldrovandia affinis]